MRLFLRLLNVLETVLVQDGILRELNPHTLNTVCVNVLNNHGKMIIPNAILSSRQGRVTTDNICAGGYVIEIDIETGNFISKFVDLSDHIYDEHPINHIKLYGEYMPCREEIQIVAFEATGGMLHRILQL